MQLALCFTEAKTTLLSFKGKEDINLDMEWIERLSPATADNHRVPVEEPSLLQSKESLAHKQVSPGLWVEGQSHTEGW